MTLDVLAQLLFLLLGLRNLGLQLFRVDLPMLEFLLLFQPSQGKLFREISPLQSRLDVLLLTHKYLDVLLQLLRLLYKLASPLALLFDLVKLLAYIKQLLL